MGQCPISWAVSPWTSGPGPRPGQLSLAFLPEEQGISYQTTGLVSTQSIHLLSSSTSTPWGGTMTGAHCSANELDPIDTSPVEVANFLAEELTLVELTHMTAMLICAGLPYLYLKGVQWLSTLAILSMDFELYKDFKSLTVFFVPDKQEKRGKSDRVDQGEGVQWWPRPGSTHLPPQVPRGHSQAAGPYLHHVLW